MKKLLGLFILFVFLIPLSAVSAQVVAQDESVVLSKETVIDENYFAAGESVTLSGTVNGDAYVAGGNLFVDGTVNGDLLIAGGTLTIDGVVTGDIRAAGGQITITGEVQGNITVAGGSVTITNTATVGKSIVAGAGQLTILGPIGKSATFGAGTVVIGNTINGNVLAGVGKLTLSPDSSIAGNLDYYSEDEAQIQPGASISGKIEYHQTELSEDRFEQIENTKSFAEGAGFFFKVYNAVIAFIMGIILISLFPRLPKMAAELIEKSPARTLGIGLLLLILVPLVSVILFITVLGIPFAFMLIFAYSMSLYFSKIFFALFVGKKLADWFKWSNSPLLFLLIGLIVWILLSSIPIIGFLTNLIVYTLGIGTIVLIKKQYFSLLKEKKLL